MSETSTWAARGVAALRLALVPVILLIESTIAYPRSGADSGFHVVLALAAVYGAVTLVLTLRSPGPPPAGWRPYAVLDATFLGLLTWTSGGATSEMRSLLAAMPFAAALIGRPRATVATAALALTAYLGAAEAYPGSPNRGYVAGESLLFAWRAALAVLLSHSVTSARDHRARRSAERQQLFARVESASDEARRDLAYALHDDVLQQLYTASMRLGAGETATTTVASEAVNNAIIRLRQMVL